MCFHANARARVCVLQMGSGFGAPAAVMPSSLNAPVGGGLGDLFDLGGGVGMPMGTFVPPKTVSLPEVEPD